MYVCTCTYVPIESSTVCVQYYTIMQKHFGHESLCQMNRLFRWWRTSWPKHPKLRTFCPAAISTCSQVSACAPFRTKKWHYNCLMNNSCCPSSSLRLHSQDDSADCPPPSCAPGYVALQATAPGDDCCDYLCQPCECTSRYLSRTEQYYNAVRLLASYI